MRVIYWLAIFIVLLIIEIATMGLTTIWFAGGALIAFCAGLVGFGLGVQIGVFVIVSILLLILTRPIAVKFFNQERQKPDGTIPKNTVVVVNGIQGVKLIVHAREE